MRTPSLRRRTTVAGVIVVTVVLLVVDLFIFLTLRAQLEGTVDDVLARRAELVARIIEEQDGDVEAIADRLGELGVPARVTAADGHEVPVVPLVPRLDELPAGTTRLGDVPAPRMSETVHAGDGDTVTVYVTRAGVAGTLQRLLVLLAIGTVVGTLLAALYLRRAADYALQPLLAVTEAARRTTAGSSGIRLEPEQPGTELGEMAGAFDEMLGALELAIEEAEAAREQGLRFLSDASHQLRTPLAGIRASVELLLSTEDEEERDRLSSNLLRETGRATRLINSLLRIARMDAGRPPQRAETDLAALCRDEVERTVDLAPQLAVTFQDHGDGSALLARVEDAGIREAVANLLDNARRHAESRIDVSLEAAGDHLVIAVRDDGPGVEPAAQQLVFERFATLDGMGGSGLGLPIARSVARSHGGDLAIRDGRFELSLPRG